MEPVQTLDKILPVGISSQNDCVADLYNNLHLLTEAGIHMYARPDSTLNRLLGLGSHWSRLLGQDRENRAVSQQHLTASVQHYPKMHLSVPVSGSC